MSFLPTPHISAKKDEISNTVLMPGDPLRAKFIAENYLSDLHCFNCVRNMLGFTGIYKGQKISVMGSGMGMPSIGIYSYELFNFYDVESIIRVGSAGAFLDEMNLNDIVISFSASTDSNYMNQYELPGVFAPTASIPLAIKAYNLAKERDLNVYSGTTLSSDIFYNAKKDANDKWKKMGVLAVEMEAAALYMNAAYAKKQALCILTVSDHLYKEDQLTSKERETGFDNMIMLALDIV